MAAARVMPNGLTTDASANPAATARRPNSQKLFGCFFIKRTKKNNRFLLKKMQTLFLLEAD
jgi:hypothetical protein